MQALRGAVADILAGIRLHPLWIALAREDIGDQHRRTTIGPVWMLFNYLAFACTFIFIFTPGPAAASHYVPYVAVGLLVWLHMMDTTMQSVTLFSREESLIRGTALPISVYILRQALQSVVRAGYALAGCLAILLASGWGPDMSWLLAGPGIAIVLVATPAAIAVCAFLGAYFPDSQFIVGHVMRIGMFLTPVFWVHGGEGGLRGAFYHWNPFTYFIESVRRPILTGELPLDALMAAFCMTLLLWLLALVLLGRYRRKIAFIL